LTLPDVSHKNRPYTRGASVSDSYLLADETQLPSNAEMMS